MYYRFVLGGGGWVVSKKKTFHLEENVDNYGLPLKQPCQGVITGRAHLGSPQQEKFPPCGPVYAAAVYATVLLRMILVQCMLLYAALQQGTLLLVQQFKQVV